MSFFVNNFWKEVESNIELPNKKKWQPATTRSRLPDAGQTGILFYKHSSILLHPSPAFQACLSRDMLLVKLYSYKYISGSNWQNKITYKVKRTCSDMLKLLKRKRVASQTGSSCLLDSKRAEQKQQGWFSRIFVKSNDPWTSFKDSLTTEPFVSWQLSPSPSSSGAWEETDISDTDRNRKLTDTAKQIRLTTLIHFMLSCLFL